MRGLRTPNLSLATQRGAVNVPNMAEGIFQPLYDYQTLLAAGATQQTFFAVPAGQGGKTKTDTNMTLAGQLPKGQRFFITGIQFEIYPGVTINGTAQSDYADDVEAVTSSGRLVLTIGSKEFCAQAPLNKFPPVNRLYMDSSTTVATDRYVYAIHTGREFAVNDLELTSNQNFSVELFDLAALPSTANARIGVTLNGWLFRNAQ